MKLIFVLAVVCVSFFPEGTKAALPKCPNTGDCSANADCADAGQPCTCNSGFHETAANICAQDVAPGSACTMNNSSTECVDNSTCESVGTGGQVASLKCMCDADFHAMGNACQPDLAPGSACTVNNSSTECVKNASCEQVVETDQAASQQCTCNMRFHAISDACQADVAPGSICTMNNTTDECVYSATCEDVAEAGHNTSLQCRCNAGFHAMAEECQADIALGAACTMPGNQTECAGAGSICANVTATGQAASLKCSCASGFHVNAQTCQADKLPGITCLIKGLNECVSGATCQNTAATGSPEVLECTCMQGFHEMNATSGCVEDTCEDTWAKCNSTGMSTCQEGATLVACMLSGYCDPQDSDQMEVFEDSVELVQAARPMDCPATVTITCTAMVADCLVTSMDSKSNCTNLGAMTECLTSANGNCTGQVEQEMMTLATTYVSRANTEFSCDCVNPATTCLTDQSLAYSVNATKCTAVKDLFTCAMTSPCNLTWAIDLQKVSTMWSQAMMWANQSACRDTINPTTATTCALQLTRCALVYGDAMQADVTNNAAQCGAVEGLHTCLTGNTGACTTDSDVVIKKLFTDLYAIVSAPCVCVNSLKKCRDAVGQLTMGPAIACTKLATYSVCVMGTKCDLVASDLDTAHSWYIQARGNFTCNITKETSCGSALSVCSNNLVNNITMNSATAEKKCQVTTESVMCVNAANCSSDVTGDVNLTSPIREAAAYRMTLLGCEVSTCNSTLEQLLGCQEIYETSFMAAGTNNIMKCAAKNQMVSCLLSHRCNVFLKDIIVTKYTALSKVYVSGCVMKSLDESSGTPSPHLPLLTLLACVAAAFLALRL